MLELNEHNFAEQTKEGLVLVDFFAHWCPPCRALAPTLEKLENIKVVKVNTDECEDLASKYSVSGIPCLIFLRNGKEIDRVVGLRSQQQLQEKVDKLNVQAS